MNVQIRLTRKLFEKIRDDLLRAHKFAAERVGFIFGTLSNQSGETPIIIFKDYHPVLDDNYVDDPTVGARINSAAIRAGMQRVLDTGNGAFHVHMHEHYGKPRFSPIDIDEIPNVVSGLRVAGPKQAHGMFLLSRDSCSAKLWMPNEVDADNPSKITIVGYPLELIS